MIRTAGKYKNDLAARAGDRKRKCTSRNETYNGKRVKIIRRACGGSVCSVRAFELPRVSFFSGLSVIFCRERILGLRNFFFFDQLGNERESMHSFGAPSEIQLQVQVCSEIKKD